MSDNYTYKDPNTDVLRAIDNAIIVVNGSDQEEYVYKNPDTDILHKFDELKDALKNSGGNKNAHKIVIIHEEIGE